MPTLALTLVSMFAARAEAAELHVDASAQPGGDGSIASPFTSIQDAIDAAANGDDIRVAAGMYSAIAVEAKELQLFGGFDAAFTEQSADTPSIVAGTAATPAVTLFEVGDSILDGFVIRGGQRGISIDADYLSTTNKPVVRNNLIEQNGDATLVGGGVFAQHCDASFTGNTVRGNIGDRGPALAAFCTTVLIEDNLIEDNVAYGDHGGALYLSGTTIAVRGNLVRNNEVGVVAGYGWGAGVTVYGEGVSATFERNVWTQNHAESLGSGAFVDDGATAIFDRDLFFANECGVGGGAGVYVDGYDVDVSSRATLVNVTIAGHTCADIVGVAIAVEAQSTVELVNSIVWGNGGDDFITDATSSITATYTLSEEPLDGEGNLSADPLFADPAAGDYHVRSTKGRFDPATGEFVQDDVDSPTIDVGDPAADFALEPGPNGLRVNLGHTGNTPEASMGGPGGEPPTGDESSGSGGADESSEAGGDVDESEGGSGTADATEGESGTGGSADADGTIAGCSCAHVPTRAPWTIVLGLVGCVALLLRRRAATT